MQSPEALDPATITQIQQGFLAALPRIMRVARFRLRHLAGDQKEEAVAETVALSWKAYRDLFLRGRDVDPLVQKIAEFSARRVRSGRKLADSPATRDVLSSVPRHECIEDTSLGLLDEMTDRNSPPADEAVLRVDYDQWRGTLEERRGQVADFLASGLNTTEVARKIGVTRTRVWQLREELKEAWDGFHG